MMRPVRMGFDAWAALTPSQRDDARDEALKDDTARRRRVLRASRQRRVLAEKNGCLVVWSDAYGEWCCGCHDDLHQSDQQCSIISKESAKRKRAP